MRLVNRFAAAVGLAIVFAGALAAADFVINNDALPATKVDYTKRPASIPATKWIGADDYNALTTAAASLRTGVVGGKLHGFTCQASRPTTPADATQFVWCDQSGRHLKYYDGTNDLDLTGAAYDYEGTCDATVAASGTPTICTIPLPPTATDTISGTFDAAWFYTSSGSKSGAATSVQVSHNTGGTWGLLGAIATGFNTSSGWSGQAHTGVDMTFPDQTHITLRLITGNAVSTHVRVHYKFLVW